VGVEANTIRQGDLNRAVGDDGAPVARKESADGRSNDATRIPSRGRPAEACYRFRGGRFAGVVESTHYFQARS